VDVEDALSVKSKQAQALMKHYNEVYLIFFKPHKQEGYLMEAVNSKNIIAIEQSKSSIKKFVEEGLEKLRQLKGYQNDPSLINACRDALNFFKDEARQIQAYTDFYMKEENFNKLKKILKANQKNNNSILTSIIMA